MGMRRREYGELILGSSLEVGAKERILLGDRQVRIVQDDGVLSLSQRGDLSVRVDVVTLAEVLKDVLERTGLIALAT
jgi:hypothetical protein